MSSFDLFHYESGKWYHDASCDSMSSFDLFHYNVSNERLKSGCDSMSSFDLFHLIFRGQVTARVVIRCLPLISSTKL